MDTVIGTNDFGEAIGIDQDEGIQDIAALEAAAVLGLDAEGLMECYPVLGAPPPNYQALMNKGKGPAQTKGKGPVQKVKEPYKRGLENVKGAAEFAKKAGTKAVSRGSAYRAKDHKPLAVVTQKGVHGIFGIVHDSVLGVTPTKLTPKQVAVVTAHNQAISLTKNAAAESIKAGNRALAQAKKADAVAKKVKPVLDRLSGKKGVHGILGFVGLVDEAEADLDLMIIDCCDPPILGLDGEYVPDPTLYDPAHWGLPPLMPYYTDFGGDNPDPNLTPLPTGGGTLSQADAKKKYTTLPPGAVPCTPPPNIPGGLGSWNVFYGSQVFSKLGSVSADGMGGVGFLWLGKGQNHTGSPMWHWLDPDGKHILSAADKKRGAAGIDVPGSETDAKVNAKLSVSEGHGPLIGNPNIPETAGLQFAMDTGEWFWTIENAPADALVPGNALLVESNATTLATDNAGIEAYNAEIMQQVKALAEAQIAQDTANALREKQDLADTEHTQKVTDQEKVQAEERERQAQVQVDREEAVRNAQFEADLVKAEQDRQRQQEQFEAQLVLQQQQMDAQAQQINAQMMQAQQQMDAQAQQAMLQTLQQPQSPYGYDPSQMGGIDPMMAMLLMQPQAQPQYGLDPSQMGGPAPLLMLLMQSQGVDPSQLPGSFDASAYYGW